MREALMSLGHDAEFIRFEPEQTPFWYPRRWLARSLQMCLSKWVTEWHSYEKKRRFSSFQDKLKLGNSRYKSPDEIRTRPPEFDAYLCGSDQVWWCTPLKHSIYFLDFGSDDMRRIAYAPSFGTDDIPEEHKPQILRCLKRFHAVSVREESGARLLCKLGIPNRVVPDPTLLHGPAVYQALMKGEAKQKSVFIYLLHKDKLEEQETCEAYLREQGEPIYYVDLHRNRTLSFKSQIPSVEEWLYQLKHASFVITNSFHAVVFSLLFHCSFVVLLRAGEGAKMNDRILTVLKKVGLERLAVEKLTRQSLVAARSDKIDWTAVDCAIRSWRQEGLDYLIQSLTESA